MSWENYERSGLLLDMKDEYLRMMDSYIQLESGELSYDEYFEEYVEMLRSVKKKHPVGFGYVYEVSTGLERDVTTEIFSGDIEKAKEILKIHLEKSRKEAMVIAKEGETFIEILKGAREEMTVMMKTLMEEMEDAK